MTYLRPTGHRAPPALPQQQPLTPPEDEPASMSPPGNERPSSSSIDKSLHTAANGTIGSSPHANGHAHQHESHPQSGGTSLFRRKSSEKLNAEPGTPQPKNGKEAGKTPPPSPGLSRRPSWMTSLTSKFGGSSQSSPASQNTTNAAVRTQHQTPPQSTSPPGPPANDSVPTGASPKSAGSGFLSSALRRFSSSNGAQMAKTVPHGGICPRKVLNVDQHRERCRIPDLQPAKLRRVAFCVDVEIAAAPKYKEEEPEELSSMTPSSTFPYPGTRKRAGSASERDKKNKAKNKERSEGEALKNPNTMAEKKDKAKQNQRKGSQDDMFEIPDLDEPPSKAEPISKSSAETNAAATLSVPPPQTQSASKSEPRSLGPKSPGSRTSTSPVHRDFGPNGMFEVDEWDDVPKPKPKDPQRRGSTGGGVHHDFGRNGMFEIPSSSEDEGFKSRDASRSRSASNVLTSPRKIAQKIGKVPVGHVFSEKLMFEIPELNDAETRIKVAQEIRKLPDPETPAIDKSLPEPSEALPQVETDDPNPTANGELFEGTNGAENPTQTSRKKEKKKRSEEERKERKEKKRQASIANGILPVEITGNDPVNTSNKPQKPQSRPTTDPLRIYRRCCQLRETNPLKRVVEQLSASSACDPLNPAIVLALDLSNQTLQLQDVVTFGDWLAVVPVQKLMLENCGLNDEAVRVVLSGLLAAKTGEQAKHNKHLARAKKPNGSKKERLGVISKLSLKNNKMIGKNGWMHIGLFLNMSRSLRAIDLSGVNFPKPPPSPDKTASAGEESAGSRSSSLDNPRPDPMDVFWKCMAERVANEELEEVVMSDCNLPAEQIEKLVDASIACKVSRLGLAHANLDTKGYHAIARYLNNNSCLGLDLGGNSFAQPDDLKIVLDAIDRPNNQMYALSVADCALTPADLRLILPVLSRLPNFRFVDFSHNRALFNSSPNALGPFGKWLPQMKVLKRLSLNDVAMRSEHAVSLAEICPEIPMFAHLSILENPALTALAHAKDEVTQEEACALYASLMAATRVSKTIVCIDIDVPSKENSEVVKALAKQVVAYSLHNMERNEYYQAAANVMAGPHGGEEAVAVPDVLLHLVGHVDRLDEDEQEETKVPDEDYLVGGTGVVKALSIVLGQKGRDSRRMSREITPVTSGSSTPKMKADATGKARDMSKNLLESARKIRHRLQPALIRAGADAPEEDNTSESASGIDVHKSFTNSGLERLGYLDATLERMIQRFEDEYPECRQAARARADTSTSAMSIPSAGHSSSFNNPFSATHEAINTPTHASPEDDDEIGSLRRASRHGSDVSLASRQLVDEEGRLHRFGQRMRREIMPPTYTEDHHWGTTGHGVEPAHVEQLRSQLEGMSSEQLRAEVEKKGIDQMVEELKITAEGLKVLEKSDPATWKKCRDAGMCVKADDAAIAVVDDNDMQGDATNGVAATRLDTENLELRNGLTRA